jgi:hypothetical protein
MAEDRLDNFGIYQLASQLFDDFWKDAEIIQKRTSVLDQIIGGLSTSINTIESKRTR